MEMKSNFSFECLIAHTTIGGVVEAVNTKAGMKALK
jgi:hypothetical protein